MRAGVGVHTASDGTRLYDGQRHPFLWLTDGTHPLATGPWEPRPLAQARQIRPAPPVGAKKPGPGRQIESQDNHNGVSRIAGQAGTPGTRPYAPTSSKRRKQGRSTTHILPAEYEWTSAQMRTVVQAYRAPKFGMGSSCCSPKRHSRSAARNPEASRGWSRARRWPAAGRVSGCGRRCGSAGVVRGTISGLTRPPTLVLSGQQSWQRGRALASIGYGRPLSLTSMTLAWKVPDGSGGRLLNQISR
jgi:hypothetical protein